MALFKKKGVPTPHAQAPPPPGSPVAAQPEPDLRETIAKLSSAIDTFVSGDLRDSATVMTITKALGAGMAPRHFPDKSIWARSLPFAEKAAAIGQWLIIVKLHQMTDYWNDDALPAFQQSNPNFVELIGWARPADRIALREKAFQAAQQLPPQTVVFPMNGDTIGNILLAESTALGRAVDWLANPAPLPTPPPTARARIDAVIERARHGDADAIAYEKALGATTDEESRRLLDEAASLGSVDAMEAAAEMAHSAGDTQSETFWAETAANAGSVTGMNRLAAIHFGAGRDNDAVAWFEKAGQAGDPDAYELLAGLANENGDHASAQHWAEVGSTAGNAECMRMKASYILNNGGAEGIAPAHTWFVEAARRGNDRAMFQAGQLAELLENQVQAAYWFTSAANLGNTAAAQRLGGESVASSGNSGFAPAASDAAFRPQAGIGSAEDWENLTIWYGQEGDMQNPGQMMWSAQLKWPDRDNLEIRDRVSIEDVLSDLSTSGWELVGVQPASGIQAQDYRLRRRRG